MPGNQEYIKLFSSMGTICGSDNTSTFTLILVVLLIYTGDEIVSHERISGDKEAYLINLRMRLSH